jgi:hypothetical protein
VTGATVGTWIEIPFANTLNDLNPKNNAALNPNHPLSPEWQGSDGQASIVYAWGGACFDDDLAEIHLPLSGGHGNYAGNEPYTGSLNQEYPAWRMLRAPSGAIGNLLTTNDGQESSGVYSDGRPRSIHPYSKPVFVPGVGPCVGTMGNMAWSAGGGSSRFLRVHPTTGEPTIGATPNPQEGGGYSSGGGATYDPSRHSVWWRSRANQAFARYDVASDTWETRGSTFYLDAYTTLSYMASDDCILWGNTGLSQQWAVFDCATNTLYQPIFSGTPAGSLRAGLAQPHWSDHHGAFLCWDNSSSTTLITRLTPGANPRSDAWTIDALTVDGSNAVTPSVRQANGTYGRSIYSNTLGGFVLLNSTSGPVYFFRSV